MVQPSRQVSAAQLLVDSLLPFRTYLAGSVVPPTYDAYARVLHPARGRTGFVRWAEIAKWSGRVYHPAMQFESIATPTAGSPIRPKPWSGGLPYDMPTSQASALARVLRPYTGTPDSVWYLVWEGYGFLPPSTEPRVQRTARSYLLFTGSLDDAADLGIARPAWMPVVADYWFPDDKSWCVATDTDLFWTYVGGSRACVDAVLRSTDLECVPAHVDHGLTIESDGINRLSPEEREKWV